jgi:LacI family transcriptional regulator, galactose operon repressor
LIDRGELVNRLGGVVQPANRRVLMDDVAARAGVSVTTVSHVLNEVPGKRIRRETRDRVRQAADELGYVLNGVARSLRTRRSQVIAMIGDEVVITPFAVGIIVGAQEAASKLGWLLVHVTTGVDRSSELAEIQALRQRQVDGFLYARMYHREVTLPEVLHDLPVVIVDGTSPDRAISSVVPDEFGGGRTAARELIRHGHTKIAFINNVDDIPASRGRLAGYCSALEEAGLEFRAEYVLRAASDAVGGLGAARALLDLDDPPQAIFCFNDRMAMGVYHAAHQRGLRIPEDLSVVGFDNQPNIADGLFPNLTTVALPHYEMGAWGVRTLVEQLTRPADSDPSQVALACPLIRRESVGPPAGQDSPVTARTSPRSTKPRGPTVSAAGLLPPDPTVPAGRHDEVPR